MISCAIRQFNDFCSAESGKINPCYTGCVIGIGKNPATIHLAIGLGEIQMVLSHPREQNHAMYLALVLVSSLNSHTFFRINGKHGDYPQQSSAG